MGIKNIHIFLISASVTIGVIFGLWCLNNQFSLFGVVSFAFAVGLSIYGWQFLKKVKSI